MRRDDETGDYDDHVDDEPVPGPGDPVGKVNLPDEPELEPVGEAAVAEPTDEMYQKILYGVLAVVMMILAMVVILQGVFEQKMPV